jgi:hypothetical protein
LISFGIGRKIINKKSATLVTVNGFYLMVADAVTSTGTITVPQQRTLNVLLDYLGVRNGKVGDVMVTNREAYIETLDDPGLEIVDDNGTAKMRFKAGSELEKLFVEMGRFERSPEGQEYLKMLAKAYK